MSFTQTGNLIHKTDSLVLFGDFRNYNREVIKVLDLDDVWYAELEEEDSETYYINIYNKSNENVAYALFDTKEDADWAFKKILSQLK